MLGESRVSSQVLMMAIERLGVVDCQLAYEKKCTLPLPTNSYGKHSPGSVVPDLSTVQW